MKKWMITALTLGMLLAVPAFAAQPAAAAYACPQGNTLCVQQGYCVNGCTGTPKHDGTGRHHGGQGRAQTQTYGHGGHGRGCR